MAFDPIRSRARRSLQHWRAGPSLLALSLALTAAPIAAQAQDSEAADDEPEIIVVRGIRASLERATEIKRQSDAFVDALAAEGIGDFPDTNLAEALQRISGVAIDRSNGEGEFVSVRGFGPEFNTVLVNGRQMPTTNDGRNFSFDTIASELVSRLEVYKTSPVELQAGGIGATIDISTPRPLDTPGLRAGITAEGLYEEASGDVTPRIFGSYSNTFANNTIGINIAGNFQRRNTEIQAVETRGYNVIPVVSDEEAAGGGGLGVSQFAGTAPAIGTSVFSPQNYDQFVNFEERERIGVNGTLQFRPVPELTVTLDGLYSEFTVESQVNSLGNWFGTLTSLEDVVVDETGTVTALTRTEANQADFIQRSFNRPDELYTFGGNVEWGPRDDLTFTWDVAYSEAESANGGADRFTVAGFNERVEYLNPANGDVPMLISASPDLGTNFERLRAHIAIEEGFGNSDSFTDEIFEMRGDFEWTPTFEPVPAWSSMKGGVLFSSREKGNTEVATSGDVLCLYCGYFLDVPDELFSTFVADDFISGRGGDGVPTEWVVYDPDALIAFLELESSAAGRDAALGLDPGTTQAILDANNGFTAQVLPSSFAIEEDIFEAYLDFGFEGEVAGGPWRASAGFRFLDTEVSSTGQQQVLLDLLEIPNDPTLLQPVFADEAATTTIDNDYTAFLPNFTVRYEPMQDVVARFAYSETLTRPSPVDLAPRVNFDVTRPDGLLASGGNPNLEPFESQNIDLSLEWYYGPLSSITFAYFRKDTKGFIVSGLEEQEFAIASNLPFESQPGTATFAVRRPVNGQDAVVDGFEISLLHNFDNLPAPFNGLGIQANATFVSSSEDFSIDEFLETGESFGIEGISDTQNVVGFYEDDRIELRIAWNRREKFLADLANPVGGLPIFTDSFSQLDARASYQVHDNAQVFFEAINFTNEEIVQFGAFESQLLNIIDTGPRFSFGVRADF
ncbi:MAG: TonB-dependent receptor [Caulobacterales bacterium]|nr:TonB-dependent receptor [Caulobacterales bacterium]